MSERRNRVAMGQTFSLGLMLVLLFALPTAAEVFNPVLIYQGSIEDNTFNISIHEGVKRFEEKTGIDCLEKVVGTNEADYIRYVEEISRQGYSPVFLLYGNHVVKLYDMARRYPKTRFVVLDMEEDEPNIYSFISGEHEGSFLAGALAAMATKSQVIGFVSVDDIPYMRRFWCGYLQGAKYINPEITVLDGFIGQYDGSWFDGKATAAMANEQMDQGADVIYQAAGGAGPAVLEAAARRGRLGIGVDRNQNHLHPGSVLTSMIKDSGKSVYAALMLAKRGIWRDNVKRMGLAQGAVGLAFDQHNASLVTPTMRQRIEKLKSDIVLGTIKVHDYTHGNSCP